MTRFLLSIILLLTFYTGINSQTSLNKADNSNTKELKNNTMFVHHVFFWLKEPNNPEAVNRFEKALAELVTIESIDHYYLGKPADTRRDIIDSSYQYSLLVVFKDKKAHDIYQEHPIHNAFRKINKELTAKVLIYDSVGY